MDNQNVVYCHRCEYAFIDIKDKGYNVICQIICKKSNQVMSFNSCCFEGKDLADKD